MAQAARALILMNGGWFSLTREFLVGEGGDERRRVPIPMALVDTADGYVLFDTGMNCEGIRDPEHTWGPRARTLTPELVPEDDVAVRLGEVGVQVRDVRLVVNSHLHWDHCGGNRLFRHCPILVQRQELAFAENPVGPVAGGYMRNHYDLPVHYEAVDGDQEIAPGVRLLATHGHTAGHQSLVVDLASGRRVVLCADAAYTHATVARTLLSANVWDRAQTLASLGRLRALGEAGATIIPGHEPELWTQLGEPPVRLA
jgi:glyoxylase-like metal-dependent hydrolase (beta-lactamase superfamily II)